MQSDRLCPEGLTYVENVSSALIANEMVGLLVCQGEEVSQKREFVLSFQ